MCLITDALPRIERVILNYLRTLPSHVDKDALRGAAYEALVKLADRFDVNNGTSFVTFAAKRVLGAMKDELRELDPQTRTDRTKLAAGETVRKDGRALKVELSSGDEMVYASDNSEISRFDLIQGEADFTDDACTRADFLAALDGVNIRHRRLVLAQALGFTQQELGDEIGVTASRICQMVEIGNRKVRARMVA